MPQKQNQQQPQQKVNTQPSPGILRRLLGNVMSDSMGQEWPELASNWASLEQRMPNETAKTNRVMNMGPLMKWMNPDAYAVTGPLGTIALNRGLIDKDKQNLNDVLTHELAHVRQGKKGFLRNIINPSRVENEAIDFEAMHSKPKPKDTNLPLIQTGPSSQQLKKIQGKNNARN